MLIESALCEDALLEWKIHFFGPVFCLVCNTVFACLAQYLVAVYDAKSTCSVHYLVPVDEFCRSLTIWNEHIRSVKILRFDQLSVFTCDVPP